MAEEKKYEVPCISEGLRPDAKTNILKVTVPGSKSITNRALLLAVLGSGSCELQGVLYSDDSRHFLQCVQDLGFLADSDEEKRIVRVEGLSGKIPKGEASLYVGSAGTAARFLAATLGVSGGTYFMDASEQMRRRPMGPLLTSLQELGCEIEYPENGKEGFFPFTIKSHGFGKNQISVNIDSSSQFLSALLIASVLSDRDFTVNVEGSHGMAYIRMTGKMMEQFGVITEEISTVAPSGKGISYKTAAGQCYKRSTYQIEPDASGAAYFYALGALLGVPVQVEHIHFNSLQGDVEFLRVLEKMGCGLKEAEDGIVLTPPADGKLKGITVDMSSFSDQAITLAAMAPFAETPVTITGIGHIRLQESDRLSAIATELGRMGIKTEEGRDSITIYPGTPNAAEIETYEDHRMAMGFALVGLLVPGVVIKNPDCCRKTFENYFELLEEVAQKLQ